MLITWMAYAALFTALAAAGALELDHLAAIWGAPRRFGWIAAVALSCGLPVLAAVRRSAPAAAPSAKSAAAVSALPVGAPAVSVPTVSAPTVSALPLRASPASTAATAAMSPPTAARHHAAIGHMFAPMSTTAPAWQLPPVWNLVAGYAWAAASVICAAFAAWAFARLRLRRAQWQRVELQGRAVWIARDLGPAVVGVVRPRIVLPAWALAVGPAERDLMARHEAEHIAAGDQGILLLGALALVVFPWNAALWMIVRRLRLAVEIDCDRRVLHTVDRPREYGMLLLAVSARRGRAVPFTASLADRRPFLERRILAMTTLRQSYPVLASLPFAAMAVLATFVAAQTPQPAPLRPSPAAAVAPAGTASVSTSVAPAVATSVSTSVAPAVAASATVSVTPAVAASASVSVAPAVVGSLSVSVAPAVAATAPVSLVPAVAASVRAAVALALAPAKATEARSSVLSTMPDVARIQPARATNTPEVALGTRDRRVTVRWENAPVDSVLHAFAAFSGRTILPSKNVTGTITADVANQPWEVALRQVMQANGYEVTVRSDGVILVDTASAPSTPPTPRARAASRESSIPIEVLRAWIQRYHPAIISGDPSANAVTFVVDANDNYVQSATWKVFDTNAAYRFGDVDPANIANVEIIKGPSAVAQYGPAAANGVVVVTTKKQAALGGTTSAMSDSDAARLRRALETRVQSIPAAPLLIVDADVVALRASHQWRYPAGPQSLHVDAQQIQSVEVLNLAGGQIGPNALLINVVKLKPGGL